MGTNYYTLSGLHIGKSSAAGWYCYKCKITLCKYGEKWIHRNHPEVERQMDRKYTRDGTNIHRIIESSELSTFDKCPKCNTPKSTKKKETCVNTCNSFTWAVNGIPNRIRIIINEYGIRITRQDFLNYLEQYCPIRYFDSIGVDFS